MDLLQQPLFDTLILGAALEGGDGWSILLSSKWQVYADEFAKYIEKSDPGKYIRNNHDDCVVFSHNLEEHITFTDRPPVEKDVSFYEMIIYY
jgi:hypothetical protein